MMRHLTNVSVNYPHTSDQNGGDFVYTCLARARVFK